MERVSAQELAAALMRSADRPEAGRALLESVRAALRPGTVDLLRVWAAAAEQRRGPTDGEGCDRNVFQVRELAEALVEEAGRIPALEVTLRMWAAVIGAEGGSSATPHRPAGAAGPSGHQVRNTISTSARVEGRVVQAHDVHGGVHFHAQPLDISSAASPVPRQLPPVPAHFTNRGRELAALQRLARVRPPAGGPVIAVISGPAGVGKTTLARRWLHGLAESFPDGQFYADLRGHSGGDPARPSDLLREFLWALGHERIPPGLNERAALWRSATAETRIAVLLDNALSAAQVRPLLPGSPTALTAVTSRGRLTGLGMDGASFHPLGVLGTAEAVELLSRRVGFERVRGEPEAAEAVVKACAGLPLAVCVAGARVAARPRQPLSVLAGALGAQGAGTLAELHVGGEYAVRGALDESYDLLPPVQARAYRRLGLAPVAVFDPPLAAAICGLAPDDAARLLDDLAEVNLLEDLGPDARTGLARYRFHDLVRSHASGLAAERETPAEARATVRRVVDHYLYLATAAEALLTPSHRTLSRSYDRAPSQQPPFRDETGALRWLDAERGQLMAVLRTADKRRWNAVTWQLVDAMWPLFLRLRPYDLWIEAHEIGLAAARREGDKDGESRMLTSGGGGLLNAEHHDEAAQWYGQALSLARREVARLAAEAGGPEQSPPGPAVRDATGGDGPDAAAGAAALVAARRAEAQALHGLGRAHRAAGRLTEAARWFRPALVLRTSIGYRRGAALTRICLGDVALAEGRGQDAVNDLTLARKDLLAEGDAYDAARALAFLGRAHSLCGGAEGLAAERELLDALGEFEAAGAVHWQGRVLEMLGECAEERDEPTRARDWYTCSLARYAPVSEADAARLQDRLRRLGD